MGLIITAVAAVIGAAVAVVVDRNIQHKKRLAKTVGAQEQSAEAIKEEATQDEDESSNPLLDRVTGLRKRLIGSKREAARKFQSWAEQNIEDVELRGWLMGLSPEAAGALVEQLSDFCSNLGFELSWLLDQSLDKDPEIEKEAIAVVTQYCQSCRSAAQSYTDFELFKVLQKIEQSPFARQRQDLSRRLFAELVKHEMAPSVPAELFLASEKERQEHMSKAIQQAAETDREQFKSVLREVMAAEANDSMTHDSSAAQAEDTDKPAEESAKKRSFLGGGSRSRKKSSSSEAESASAGSPAATSDMPPAAEPSTSS